MTHRDTVDPYDDHDAENDAIEAMRKSGEWTYTPAALLKPKGAEK